MKKQTLLSVLILLALVLRVVFGGILARLFRIEGEWLTLIYQAVWYLVPLLIVLLVFYRLREIPSELGLSSSLSKGVIPALIITLPMTISYALLGSFPDAATAARILAISVFAGFFEELWFRGFVFGQLFRWAGWGFIPAVLANGLIFGLGHLYQTSDPAESVMVFAVTLLGAGWFSWIYIESGGNLWLPVSLHFLMNLSWGTFGMDDTAAGGLAANIPRIVTIALSILYILIFVREGRPLKIRTSNLWINRQQRNDENGKGQGQTV